MVSGIGPGSAGNRRLMVLQAYIDESITHGSTFVLGGYIASAETWAKFSKDWEAMLPHGTLGSNGKYHFKMAEMAANEERMSRVPGFYRIIEKHDLLGVFCEFNIADLRRAQARVRFWPPAQIDFDLFANPYGMAFRGLMDTFHNRRSDLYLPVIPLSEKVDFIFDDRIHEKAFLVGMWDEYVRKREDNIRDYYGATPRFENDEDFLPLQAADFLCWWIRRAYDEGENADKFYSGDFDTWKSTRNLKGSGITFSEDELTQALIEVARGSAEPWRIAYDVKTSPRKFSLSWRQPISLNWGAAHS